MLRDDKMRDPVADLVHQYRPLVHGIVGRTKCTLPPSISFDELYAAGLEGLWRAAKRYDPTRKVKFSTYAAQSVRWAIWEWLRSNDVVGRKSRAEGIRPILVTLCTPLPCPDHTSADELLVHLCYGMSEEDQQLVRLRYLDGYQVAEMVDQTGHSRNWIRGRFKRNILPHLRRRRQLSIH